MQLMSGQPTTECGRTPIEGVTYPAFKSDEPIYGAVTFAMSLFDPQAGLRYNFALDRSAGTDYDRLYFDVNRDGDLTNDPFLGRADGTSDGMQNRSGDILFENIQIEMDYGPGQGTFTQTVMPRLRGMGETTYMFFAAPTARKGKIMLGSREVELVLGQAHTIAGRYDTPMTGTFLNGTTESLPLAGYWRSVKGTFYRLSATPAGDKVTVAPYAGPFGVLETGAGGRDMAAPTLEFGWVYSRDALIDVDECPHKDGKLSLPVGDYRPFRMAVRYDQRRIGLGVDTAQLGKPDATPISFFITIREDTPFVLDFSAKPEVVFKSPTGGQRVKTGQTLKVEAMLCDLANGMMISALEDTTKKTGSANLPSGREMDMFESVAPTIKITNASGKTVAEGPMPFG
ncbi:MAG: hypothetical protein JW993_19455 [Sedimentisphaerales bacterium]|nr:hypothetical protein [Sedimentisphaerales bacterium]